MIAYANVVALLEDLKSRGPGPSLRTRIGLR